MTGTHIAARLRGRYDVVSLFQHLERVPDPRAELRAALGALRPGGHLLVDVADPRRLFPVHPVGLNAELVAQGCTVLVFAYGDENPADLLEEMLVKAGAAPLKSSRYYRDTAAQPEAEVPSVDTTAEDNLEQQAEAQGVSVDVAAEMAAA